MVSIGHGALAPVRASVDRAHRPSRSDDGFFERRRGRCEARASSIRRGAIEDQDRDVTVARRVPASRRDDGPHGRLSPGQVFAAKLDANVLGLHVMREHLVMPRAGGHAVVCRQHAILLDQRSRAGHAADHEPHDVVVPIVENERQLKGGRQVWRPGDAGEASALCGFAKNGGFRTAHGQYRRGRRGEGLSVLKPDPIPERERSSSSAASRVPHVRACLEVACGKFRHNQRINLE